MTHMLAFALGMIAGGAVLLVWGAIAGSERDRDEAPGGGLDDVTRARIRRDGAGTGPAYGVRVGRPGVIPRQPSEAPRYPPSPPLQALLLFPGTDHIGRGGAA